MPAKHLSNDSLGILVTDRRRFYLRENVTKELWPSVAPFTTILSNKGTDRVPDPDFRMFEHRSGFVRQGFALAGSPAAWDPNGAPGILSAGATVTGKFGLGDNAGADSALIGLTFEVYRDGAYVGFVAVHDVNTANGQITLRSLGNPRAANNQIANLAAGDVLIVSGSAIGEGQTSPDPHHDDLELVYNSSQIFRTPLEITGTLHESSLRGYNKELARMRMEKNKEHKMQKERAFLYGARVSGITGTGFDASEAAGTHTVDRDGKKVRTTMGLITALYRHGSNDETSDDQAVFARAMASYTYGKFVDDMEKVFWYIPNSGYKTAICGPGAMSFWSKVGEEGFHKGNLRVQISDLQMDKLRFHFKWLETPHGMLKLVLAPALRHEYRNHMVILDEGNVGHIKYRDMYYATNIKTENNYDGQKDEYFSDEGIRIQLLESHKLFIFN